MPMDLAAAVVRARDDRLDDDGTRWTDEATVRALKYALSDTAYEYTDAGGDQLKQHAEVTSTATGYIATASLNVAQIHGLALKVGGRSYRLYASQVTEDAILDDVARTFELDYSVEPLIGTATFDGSGAFATGDTNPLISTDGTTQLVTWDNFEDLVCNRAAQKLAVKDADRMVLSVLQQEEQRLLANVIKRDNKPRARLLPRRQGYYSRLLTWHWDPSTEYIHIHKRL